MQETYTKNQSTDVHDEIDLRELFNVLLAGKWIIISITTFVSIIAVIYSLMLPNIYESKALLVPVNASGGISGSRDGYSGLIGFAGISIPAGSDNANAKEAIKKINSLSFFENNIINNIYLPDLVAVKSWNSKTNTVAFDDNIFDRSTNSWSQQKPSAQMSYEVFKIRHLSLSEEKKSGFITLSIKHQSPYIAKQWAELVINEINSFYRQKDKSESEKAVSYLNQQISKTGLSEIKQVLAVLLQEEIKKLTLIEANQYYVFDYIDPPAVMENKLEPNRALICILSALLGGMLSILLVLIRYYVFSERN